MDQLFLEPCLFSGLMLANSSRSHLLDVALKCFQTSTPSADSTQPLSYIEIETGNLLGATLYTDRATREPVPYSHLEGLDGLSLSALPKGLRALSRHQNFDGPGSW